MYSVQIRLVSPFLAVVKKLSSDSAKVGFRVQFPAAGPFYSRVVKHKSWHASNVPFRVGIPARGPFALVAEHTGGGVLTRTMQVRILPGAPLGWVTVSTGEARSRKAVDATALGCKSSLIRHLQPASSCTMSAPLIRERQLVRIQRGLLFGGLNRRVPMPVC